MRCDPSSDSLGWFACDAQCDAVFIFSNVDNPVSSDLMEAGRIGGLTGMNVGCLEGVIAGG